jgi:hypothetical protein
MGLSRYEYLKDVNGNLLSMPKVKIEQRDTDKFVLYDPMKMRLDRIANEVYEDDTYNWLILLANPEYYMEFDIPKGAIIRVPFPLLDVISEFQVKILKGKIT